MSKPILRALATLVLLIAGASACLGAEKNMFKDLPGVVPPRAFPPTGRSAPTATRRSFPYYQGRRQLPIRMYSCKNGLVTYESTISPGFNPPAGDPYVHGENLQGFPGTPN